MKDRQSKVVESEHSNRRKYLRFKADLGTLIKLYLDIDNVKSLKGVVIDSSLAGCGIVVVVEQEDLLEEDQVCHIKFFEEYDDYVKVKIAWIKKIEDHVLRMGIQYLNRS